MCCLQGCSAFPPAADGRFTSNHDTRLSRQARRGRVRRGAPAAPTFRIYLLRRSSLKLHRYTGGRVAQKNKLLGATNGIVAILEPLSADERTKALTAALTILGDG